MNGKHIPGFYWDPDKKKYFRIQANHVAPTGSQYSREAVKKRKLDNEERKRKATVGRRIRRERVQTPRCLTHNVTRLAAEVGNRPVPGFVKKSQQGGIYASQLQRRNICSMDGLVPSDSGSMADFVRHGASGVLVAGINSGGSCKIIYRLYRCATQVTSSAPNDEVRATMDSGSRGESTLGIGFLNQMNTMNEEGSWHNRLSRIEDSATLWCSAARPEPDNPLFAIGTSDGLYTVAVNPDRLTLTRAHIPIPQKSGGRRNFSNNKQISANSMNLISVEWLSETVIASGFRNSSLYLSDLRSNGHSRRIKHPHPIEQIRKIDDYRLVCAGYESLQMYDLRYPNTETVGSKQHRHGMCTTSTKPYLVFDDYMRQIGHKIDINRELGLLAALTNNHNIQLYSLADGSVVPSASSLLSPQFPDGGNVCRILFEEYEYPIHQQQAPRLLFSRGQTIQELGW
ncbi:hypothetical protein UA08_07670 [Talaromyces atroroseus]|uniref:Myocyte-specific enhancer factor 2d n=1 Tax=Talaromyces atroroseus TaxID=1441469 RepID=A0A225AIU7_TALAT|nr:hypothetical protein UA08_07670 [Talaromyces atroroseus]OKL57078.1 hypothetical protein UA08_07670 [Talaromyces atroroseus]